MRFWDRQVLFIDGEALVIDKPAGLAVHPGSRTPREPRRLSSPTSLRISAAAAAGPPARPRYVRLPAARPQSQGAQAPSSAPSRRNRSTRPMSRCWTACRRRRAGRSTWRSARSRPPRRAGGWCPTTRGKPAVTHWRVACGAGRARRDRVHAGDRAHPPDPRPRRRGHRHRRSRAIRSMARGKGPMLLHALSLQVDRGGKPPVEATAPLPPTFVNAGFGDVDLGLSMPIPEEALSENVPRRVRAGRAERQQGGDRLPAALRRVQARARAGRLSAAEGAGRQPDDRRRRDRDHRAQLPHAGGEPRGCAGAAGGTDRRRPMSVRSSGSRPRPSRAAKAKRVDGKKQRGAVKQGRGKVSWTDVRLQDRGGGQGRRFIASSTEAADALTAGEPDRSPTWPMSRP